MQRQNWPQLELSSWLGWTIVSQSLDQQLVRTYMVLLQLINHLINRYITSSWLSTTREFASTEKFFQVSPPLELEAQTGSKIFPKITWLVELFYVTGRTFFVGNSRNRSGFPYFRTLSKLFWTEWVAYLFFSANFTLISEKWLWPLEYPFKKNPGWYLLGVQLQFPDKDPRIIYMGVPPPGGAVNYTVVDKTVDQVSSEDEIRRFQKHVCCTALTFTTHCCYLSSAHISLLTCLKRPYLVSKLLMNQLTKLQFLGIFVDPSSRKDLSTTK